MNDIGTIDPHINYKLDKPDVTELNVRLNTASVLLQELAGLIKRKYEADVAYAYDGSNENYNPIKEKSYDLNNKENRCNLCDVANIVYIDNLNRNSNMSSELDQLNRVLYTLESLLGVKYE